MRFGFGRGAPAKERPLDPPAAAASQQCEYPVQPRSLTWDLRRDGLTTQYKAFYFSFSDGSAGYMQVAYGNLGVLVKVCPLGFTYYRQGKEPIVLSHTLHASSMQLGDGDRSVKIGQHTLEYKDHPTDPDGAVWHARINDGALKYDLTFTTLFGEADGGGALVVHDFGRDTPKEWVQHRVVPRLSVSGTVQAHGDTSPVAVTGEALHIDAVFAHVKFTDLCDEFVNFQLRSEDGRDALLLLGYVPRAGSPATGPRIAHGYYARDGRIVGVAFDGIEIDTQPGDASTSGGEVPATPATQRHEPSGYDLPLANRFTWRGRLLPSASGHADSATGEDKRSLTETTNTPTATATFTDTDKGTGTGTGATPDSTLASGSFTATVRVDLAAAPTSVTDVLGIFPKFFKDIVAVWAGSPYVFCWHTPATEAIVTLNRAQGSTGADRDDGAQSEERRFKGMGLFELTAVHKPR